jgi:hypothetical protein
VPEREPKDAVAASFGFSFEVGSYPIAVTFDTDRHAIPLRVGLSGRADGNLLDVAVFPGASRSELLNKPAARPDRCVACLFAPRLST